MNVEIVIFPETKVAAIKHFGVRKQNSSPTNALPDSITASRWSSNNVKIRAFAFRIRHETFTDLFGSRIQTDIFTARYLCGSVYFTIRAIACPASCKIRAFAFRRHDTFTDLLECRIQKGIFTGRLDCGSAYCMIRALACRIKKDTCGFSKPCRNLRVC